jgi:hypothetical protein
MIAVQFVDGRAEKGKQVASIMPDNRGDVSPSAQIRGVSYR